MKKVDEVIHFGIYNPDMFYKKKSIGTIRFEGKFVKISENFGVFMTASSFQGFPENLKVKFWFTFFKLTQVNALNRIIFV